MNERITSEGQSLELLTHDRAERFVRENVVPARTGERCVDGRYAIADENTGMLARPGGDKGLVMTLLAINHMKRLGLAPQECFDIVYDIVVSEHGSFNMHTDAGSDPEHDWYFATDKDDIGCGHVKKATELNTAAPYTLSPNDKHHVRIFAGEVGQLTQYARQRMAMGDPIRMVNLAGQHLEQSVMIVTGTRNTINSQNDGMHFVYDKTRDDALCNFVVARLAIPQVTVEEFIDTRDKQTSATLKLLALGKPIFAVDADKPVPHVTAAGIIT